MTGTSKLEHNLRACNELIDEYDRKQIAYEEARDKVLRLMVPMQPAQNEIMTKIGDLLEELDGYFVELGYIDEGGKFDLDSYRRMKLIRRIVDGKVRSLGEVPEEMRADFEDVFDDEADEDGRWIHGDLHRETEVIRDELETCMEELQFYLAPVMGINVHEGFQQYLAGIKKVPEALDLFIENLNNVWLDYKDAASAVCNNFQGR